MATSKSFFGKRRGSTKNFTFAVFNGKQVTKEKAEQVKNPRTLAQMRNRMILTTSSAAYAAMKEIVDHSFQGYVYGLQNMSRFQSVNNKLLRANIGVVTSQFAYANYGDARVLPGAYVISEGSLAPIPTAMFACAITGANSVAFTLQPGVTAAELTADAIISALGLQVGELATLCFLADCGTEAGYKFGFIRLTVKAAGSVQLTAQNLTEYFDIESNAPVAITSVADGTAVITATIDGVLANGGLCYGCIHSANENGSWKRSDTTMTIANGTLLEPTATQAIATYPVGGSKILNNGDIPGGHGIGDDVNTVTVATEAGNDVTLERLGTYSYDDEGTTVTEIVALTADDTQIHLKNAKTTSRGYGMFLTSKTANEGEAWLSEGEEYQQNIIVDVPGNTGELWDWLAANGVSVNVWIF